MSGGPRSTGMPGTVRRRSVRTRVLVVAEDPRVRTSIRHLLASDRALDVVVDDHRSPSHQGDLRQVTDVVVYDIGAPKVTSSLSPLQEISKAVPVVALGFDDADRAMALDAGARAYLSKTTSADELLATVYQSAHSPDARAGLHRPRGRSLVHSAAPSRHQPPPVDGGQTPGALDERPWWGRQPRPVWTAVGLVLSANAVVVAVALLGERLFPRGGDGAELVCRLTAVLVVALGALLVVGKARAWRSTAAAGPRTWRDTRLLILPAVVALAPLAAGLDVPPPATLTVLILGYSATGVFEELWHRGVVLDALRPTGLRKSAVIGGALFGASHLTNVAFGQPLAVSLAQAVGAFCFGIGFSILRWRTDAVWLLAGIHATADLMFKVTNLHGSLLWGALVGHDIAMLLWGLWCLRTVKETAAPLTSDHNLGRPARSRSTADVITADLRMPDRRANI